MIWRLVRLTGAAVLALVLVLWYEYPLPKAASSSVSEQPAPPPASTHRTYWAGGRPVIKQWMTAEYFLYAHDLPRPQPYADSLYVDPAFEEWIVRMRPAILDSARRHNHPELTGMDDRQFAVLIAAILYLENNAALNDRSQPGRVVTPFYQSLQVSANQGIGTDFSILPTNLRPSVAIDILRGRIPLPPNEDGISAMYRPIVLHGSKLQKKLRATPVVDGWTPATEAVMAELTNDRLAIEYLAANLEIAQYRCLYEWVPISWATLVAWNAQGVVSPYAIREVPQAALAITRLEQYLPFAAKLIYNPTRDPLLGAPGSAYVPR